MAKSKAKLSDFTVQSKNVNRHKNRGMKALRDTIDEGGWVGAITTAANGETFAGSARLEVSYDRFGDEIEPITVHTTGDRPVIVIRDDIPTASDPKAVKLGVADNRISEINYDPDIELLIEINDEIIQLDDLYYEDELAALAQANQDLIEQEQQPSQKEEEDEDALERSLDNVGKVESRVKLGEIWQLGRHRIACGDSTVEGNVRALLGDRFSDVGMVWADAPYGINVVAKDGSLGVTPKGKYSQVLGDETKEVAYNSFSICQKLFSKSVQFFWGANHFASAVSDSSCWIVWDKQDGKSVTFADCELAWTNIQQPARVFKHIWDGFRRDSERGDMRVHPTQKPVALPEWAFDKYGQSDDVIFDPFLGSAPSIIAAQKMQGDRTVYGFELSPDYCTVILNRYENFTGDIAKLVGYL